MVYIAAGVVHTRMCTTVTFVRMHMLCMLLCANSDVHTLAYTYVYSHGFCDLKLSMLAEKLGLPVSHPWTRARS